MLVYMERFYDPSAGIKREKELKGWRRQKKLKLILSVNPDWADLSAEWREDEFLASYSRCQAAICVTQATSPKLIAAVLILTA
jgi:hypothetical protein